MEVLLVNGFGPDEPAPAIVEVHAGLRRAGNQVHCFELAAHGFDEFMTAAERAAYHTETPLVTAEAKAAAEAVLAAEALVVCYPIVHGTAPARVKSWQERVFVLGLAFRFTPSGRITGALDHLHRALVLGVAKAAVPNRRRTPADHRNSFGPCLARSFFLSSNRRCRSRYLTVEPGDSGRAQSIIARW
jgi:putative NADPH-quinone reductase